MFLTLKKLAKLLVAGSTEPNEQGLPLWSFTPKTNLARIRPPQVIGERSKICRVLEGLARVFPMYCFQHQKFFLHARRPEYTGRTLYARQYEVDSSPQRRSGTGDFSDTRATDQTEPVGDRVLRLRVVS